MMKGGSHFFKKPDHLILQDNQIHFMELNSVRGYFLKRRGMPNVKFWDNFGERKQCSNNKYRIYSIQGLIMFTIDGVGA